MKEIIIQLKNALASADCILIGAGAGLSTAAGYDYAGARFLKYFSDFHTRFGIEDIYSGGFYPFPSREMFWAWWSRSIWINRYAPMPTSDVYPNLLHLVEGRDYFILTTNVDHAFQRLGVASAGKTYDNEESVRVMLTTQGFAFAEDGTLLPPESGAPAMVIPSDLIPCCPDDGMEMTTNLRADASFVEDAGWHAAAARYTDYLTHTEGRRTLLLELGVGMNTPGIIKYPFWRMTAERADVTFAAVNLGMGYVPPEIAPRSMIINGDIAETLRMLAS